MISPHAVALLRHHAFQGNSNDCGPCCAAMVIGATTSHPVAAAVLARRMDRPVWRGLWPVVRRLPRSATFPWGIVDALTCHGCPARWRPAASADALRNAVAMGQLPLVVIGDWRPFWIHWVIVLGWDPQAGWGVVDPAVSEARIEWHGQAQFERRWRAFGRVLVVADPRPRISP